MDKYNGPTDAGQMAGWAEGYDMELEFIQSGNSTQNLYVEQFNRTYGTEVLDFYQFRASLR